MTHSILYHGDTPPAFTAAEGRANAKEGTYLDSCWSPLLAVRHVTGWSGCPGLCDAVRVRCPMAVATKVEVRAMRVVAKEARMERPVTPIKY